MRRTASYPEDEKAPPLAAYFGERVGKFIHCSWIDGSCELADLVQVQDRV
jgi:hypothetical protein